MRTHARSTSVLAVVLLLLAGSLLPAAAAGGNVSEEDLDGYDWCAKFELQANAYVLDGELSYVTITSGDAIGGTFTSTQPVSVVFVKGGPDNDGGTLYDPPVMSGSFSNAGLPLVGSDDMPGISNIVFCGDYPPPMVDVEVTIAKEWTGALESAPEGTELRFEVRIGEDEQVVGVDEAATFAGLIEGEEYTIEWEELLATLPAPFVDDAGATCSFNLDGSTVMGEETFVAGEPMVGLMVEAPAVQRFSFTASNDYECVPPPTPSSASVVVSKVWTVDGEVVPTPEDVDLAFDVTLGDETQALTGTGTETFSDLTVGATYPVTVEEDLTALPDGEELFGVGCELVSTDVVLSATSVTAPGSVTATVTNAYVCPEVEDVVLVAVDIEAGKTWFQTSDDGLVELEEAPEGAAPSYEVVVKGPDAEIVTVEQLDAGDSLTLLGLEDGETYLLTWEEIDPLAEFELDGATCTWQEESAYFGSEIFVAGDVDTVSFTGGNVYECLEVLGTVVVTPTALPKTGVPALWLTLMGLLGVGIGGGLLGRRRVW